MEGMAATQDDGPSVRADYTRDEPGGKWDASAESRAGRSGGRGEAEAGEDIDLSEPADWRTVLLLAGVFLATAVLIEPVGFPVAGALLFWGAAYALGSRAFHRDPLIAAGLSLVTYAVFNNLLGVPLPGGPLMGVL